MLTPEEYMEAVALRRQGFTIEQIAEALDKHPATISSWLKQGGPPSKRQPPAGYVPVVSEHWAARIDELLQANKNLLVTSIERILRAEGYEGSYESLVRHLRRLRGPRRQKPAVSMPIETPAAKEFQFDWSDCCDWGETWGLGELHCFGAVLCFSRRRFWWFAPSYDRAHTFEGLVLFFEDVGGIAAIGRTDRMGALGTSRGGIFRFSPEAIEFACYHGFCFKACRARDAKRKGKSERPFGELNDSFMQEMALRPPGSLAELNRRAARWLADYVHDRPHRSTGEAPSLRLATEAPLLGPLPRTRFDTARREPRVVNRPFPLIEVDRARYSVPPELVGKLVEVAIPVSAGVLHIAYRGELVVTHRLGAPGEAVWDPAHKAAAEKIALAPHRREHTTAVVASPAVAGPAAVVPALLLGHGDFEVEPLELSCYDLACGCTGAGL